MENPIKFSMALPQDLDATQVDWSPLVRNTDNRGRNRRRHRPYRKADVQPPYWKRKRQTGRERRTQVLRWCNL